MRRCIRLLIAYDGLAYNGWQCQRQGEVTIQGQLEQGLMRLCRHALTLHGAGRTDAGVHALGMVAHFHTNTSLPLVAFYKGLNSMLPPDIRILKAEEAEENFHSRFSARAKTYRYDFFTGEVMPPERRLYCGHFPGFFQSQHLASALQTLEGKHDFSSFERAGSRDRQASSGRGAVRTIFQAQCLAFPGLQQTWSLRFIGDGFLRQMVRILAGTLIYMGQGKIDPSAMASILAATDRRCAGPTAPACGLFLEQVHYQDFI